MRLRDKNRTPVGGFFYDDPITGDRIATDSTLENLIDQVRANLSQNGHAVPDKLKEMIEDQICMRQPPDRCYYTKGLGDTISRVIHAGARAVDKVAGTKLETKARRCGSCGSRRVTLNSR